MTSTLGYWNIRGVSSIFIVSNHTIEYILSRCNTSHAVHVSTGISILLYKGLQVATLNMFKVQSHEICVGYTARVRALCIYGRE